MDIHPALIEAAAKALYDFDHEELHELAMEEGEAVLRAVFAVKAKCETCEGSGTDACGISDAPCDVRGGSGESTLPLHITETMERVVGVRVKDGLVTQSGHVGQELDARHGVSVFRLKNETGEAP